MKRAYQLFMTTMALFFAGCATREFGNPHLFGGTFLDLKSNYTFEYSTESDAFANCVAKGTWAMERMEGLRVIRLDVSSTDADDIENCYMVTEHNRWFITSGGIVLVGKFIKRKNMNEFANPQESGGEFLNLKNDDTYEYGYGKDLSGAYCIFKGAWSTERMEGMKVVALWFNGADSGADGRCNPVDRHPYWLTTSDGIIRVVGYLTNRKRRETTGQQ